MKTRSAGNHRRGVTKVVVNAAARRPAMGEATLIAGVTAEAYMVALAYRVGGLMRLGLPLSLATVRLTDAAVAGLVVLVGGSFLVLLSDLVESRRAGVLHQAWLALVFVSLSTFIVLITLLILVFLFTIGAYAGSRWALMGGLLTLAVTVPVVGALRRVASGVSQMKWDDLVLARTLDRNPAVAGSILLAVLLCAGSLYFGFSGISFGRTAYLQTVAADEVAIGLFEDRVILAGIEPTVSDEATLTGSLRVVPLPSDEVVFSTKRLHDLRPRGR